MSDTLSREKRRADTMRRLSAGTEADYWHGYRVGLTARSDHHDAMLAGIGRTESKIPRGSAAAPPPTSISVVAPAASVWCAPVAVVPAASRP